MPDPPDQSYTTYLSPLPVDDAGLAPAAKPAAMPFIGQVLEFDPGRRLVHVKRFDLNEDLYLVDHAFINCLDVKPLRECFPVVPLTVTLEMLAESGACLAPGMGPIRFENIKAKRWIALDEVDALDVRIPTQHPRSVGRLVNRLELPENFQAIV